MTTKQMTLAMRLLLVVVCIVFSGINAHAQNFTGPTTVCVNSNYNYSYWDDVIYTSVTWSVTGGGTIVSGTGLSRVIKWSADGTVTVKMFNGAQLVSQATKNVTVNLPGTISGPSQVCSGNSITISKSGQSGTFLWEVSVNGGTSWTSLGGNSTLVHTPTQNSQYRLRITECSRSNLSNVLSVTVNPSTVAGVLQVSAGSDLCENGTVYLNFSTNPVGTIQWQQRYKDGVNGAFTSWNTFATGTIPSNSYAATSAGADRYYEFRVIVQSGVCSSLTGNTVTAVVYKTPAMGTLSVSETSFYGDTGPLNLSVSSNTGTVSYEYSTNGTTWLATSNPTASFSQSVQLRAKSTNGVCAVSYSNEITINVFPSPVITINGPDEIVPGVTTNLSVQSSFTSYQWLKDDIEISGATSNTYTAREPGVYKIKVKGSSTAAWAFALPVTIGSALFSQPQAINYKVVTNVYKEGFTTSSNFFLLEPNEVKQAVTYMDGKGRTVQQIAIGQTPSRKDFVQPYQFNDAGTTQTAYLGYASQLINGRYKMDALNSNGNYVGSEQQVFYQSGNAIAIDAAPYAKTVLEAGPLERALEQGAPGTSWQPGSNHTVRQALQVNNAAHADVALKNIRQWTTAGPQGTYYGDNQLMVATTTDENGNKTWSFSDKLGRPILKRVQLDETVEGMSTPFLETYYVYDDRGNLALQIPPKATAKLNNGSAWNTSFRDEWCFIYTYDEKNRLIEKKTPDSEATYYGYDPLDRLTLMQDGNLRSLNKWMFIKYDVKGRSTMTGLYVNTTHVTRAAIQTNVLDLLYATGLWYEEKGSALHGYTNASFPTQNSDGSALKILGVNYYDNHDFNNDGTPDFNYEGQSLPGEGQASSRIYGLPTGSKRMVLDGTDWLYQYVFYDKYGRAIQTRSNNHLSLAIDNLTTYVYAFDGTLTYIKAEHKGSNSTAVSTVTRMEYDHSGRPLKLYYAINGGTEVLAVAYLYNELGQLIDKKLHSTDGANYLQSVDFRYSIRGWLTSINNAQLTNDPLVNDDTGDYFGMELVYNNTESGLSNTPYYNGNISAIKWKGVGAIEGLEEQRSYAYTYDKSDKLKSAASKVRSSTVWDKEVNAHNETMSYDHNGNIITLQRNQRKHELDGVLASYTAEAMDNLTYSYTQGNKLSKVEDGAISAGFNNAVNQPTEYTYDNTGSITADYNKGISNIVYNELGKAKQVNFTDGRVINYTYDASGNKLKMSVTQNSVTTTTDYVGGFVYENNNLSFFGSPEGRAIKNGSNYEYQYSIADHQGNTRVVFSSVAPAPITTITDFESGTSDFQNYTNRTNFELMDHTDATTDATDYSQKLTGGNNSQVGVTKTLKVYPGDKVKIEAYAKYYNAQSTQSNLSGFALALTNAFGVSSSSTGEALEAFNSLNNYGGFIALGEGGGSSEHPKLFVNILLFDKNYKFLDAAWDQIDGGEQIGTSPKAAHDYMMQEVTVKEEGYVYVYVSNENPTLVDFYIDDVTVTQTPSNVIQYNEYYPFGLQTSTSWTRENAKGNAFLYNSGSEMNTTTSNYEMFFREYDPALGRMNAVDPMASKYASLTPYNYAFNDPVYWNDPLGDDPNDPSRGVNWYRYRMNSDGTKEYIDASGGMYGVLWDMATYGTPFVRYGVSGAGHWELGSGGSFERIKGTPDTSLAPGTPDEYLFTPEERWVFVEDPAPVGPENVNRPGDPEGPQTWYFMSRDPGAPHGLAYDPNTGMIYEVNHPARGHGLLLWLEGILLNSVPNNGNTFSETKSVAYKWDMTKEKEAADFWKREKGSTFLLSPVTVTNPAAATAWFQSQQGTPWNYNFFTNNCAHYAVQGLNSGGAGINFIGPKPSSFPVAPTMTWSAGQASPVPIGK